MTLIRFRLLSVDGQRQLFLAAGYTDVLRFLKNATRAGLRYRQEAPVALTETVNKLFAHTLFLRAILFLFRRRVELRVVDRDILSNLNVLSGCAEMTVVQV